MNKTISLRRHAAGRPSATESPDGSAPRPLHNTALLTAASLAAKGCSFVLFLVAARVLRKDGFGEYNYIMSYVGLFAVLTDLGLTTLAVRDAAQDRGLLPRYLGNVLVLRLLLATATALLCIAIAALVRYPANVHRDVVIPGIVVWACALIPIAVVGTAGIAFQAVERMAPLSALTAAISGVTALAGIAVLLAGGRVVALVAVAGAANLGAALVALILVARLVPLRLRVDVEWWPSLLRVAMPFAVLTLLNVLYSNADSVLVNDIKGSADSGLYGVAYRFVSTLLTVVISPFNAAVLPAFNRIAAASRERLQHLVLSGLRITFAIGLPVAVAATWYAGTILRIVGKTEYLPAVPALQWLAWSFPLFMVLAILYNALYAVHRANSVAITFGVTLVFNVVLNLLLIPRYSYFASAALTTLSEALNVLLAGWAVRRWLVDPLPVWPAFAKTFLAALVMAAILQILHGLPFVITLPLGALAYLGVVRLLRVFGDAERGILARLPVAGRYARWL